MEGSQREFLLLLGYLHARYAKYDEAFLLLHGLKECCPEDEEVAIALAHACLRTERIPEAHRVLESLERRPLPARQEKLFFLLQSRILWALGRDGAARDALVHYLGLEERELRLHGYRKQWAFHPKEKLRT
ncbi:MAG: hypothetical protein LBT57_03035 [Puniceicoccales bacterium]|jgi:hypothetical protein|nr:hypothetical protein [Puniceicoccales bacterium]